MNELKELGCVYACLAMGLPRYTWYMDEFRTLERSGKEVVCICLTGICRRQ